MEFQPGDVVQLLSGGAAMNVRSVSTSAAFCTWLDNTGARQVDVFPFSQLKLLHRLPPPPNWNPETPRPEE
ncbi:MAG TPA: DUF2158 domain-containing protein [Ramlibacter sp.]|jgi:uncharacterized protein YodC (DUF2158 family)|uniref:YodC family protein n=1 Tax=Ramlibacter sp. TaxID=1917967 RepID=UPI002D708265|nr:DUF2158 domain-containing protein [Ramlibacter sp.]HZY18293.1 DUF2158 domain-containing protein [Ramlibacter sp.]